MLLITPLTPHEIRVESFYATFSRTFALPDSIDAKGIRAEEKDGVLRVHVPKAEGAKSSATQIEGNEIT